MASYVFNIAKGTTREKAKRGETLKACILKAAADQATLEDLDTLAAVLADASTTEADFTNYARPTLTNFTDTVDDTDNDVDLSANAIVFPSAGGTVNNNTVSVIIYHDVDGTDANAIPLLHLDFAATTDGNDLTMAFPSNGFFGAS